MHFELLRQPVCDCLFLGGLKSSTARLCEGALAPISTEEPADGCVLLPSMLCCCKCKPSLLLHAHTEDNSRGNVWGTDLCMRYLSQDAKSAGWELSFAFPGFPLCPPVKAFRLPNSVMVTILQYMSTMIKRHLIFIFFMLLCSP